MTGLNQKAFEALLPSFAQAYEQRQRWAGQTSSHSPLTRERRKRW